MNELMNELDFLSLEIMRGKELENIGLFNSHKEKVLKILLGKATELEKDKEKNFVELENIKLFLQNNFK